MSGCENATPNTTRPPEARNAVRRAWVWLAAYVLVELSFQTLFEWLNAVKGNGHDYPFFDGPVLSFSAQRRSYSLGRF